MTLALATACTPPASSPANDGTCCVALGDAPIGAGSAGDPLAGDGDLASCQPGDCSPFVGGTVTGEINDTQPRDAATVTIGTFGTFAFEPLDVSTVRPDLFRPGFFSLFDILVHLADRGEITLAWHFDASLDTNVIDDLNGASDWWYDVRFDGGWAERSYHRMDYYPYKDLATVIYEPGDAAQRAIRHRVWAAEVERRAADGGRLIVPEVTVLGTSETLTFENVVVTAHDLRPDVFVSGVPTAIDVIMSLGEQAELTYELVWREHLGQSEVKSFFIHAIDADAHSGHCGFVYEVGDAAERHGNHIHLMSDLRVLQAPEYALFFWIRLGPC